MQGIRFLGIGSYLPEQKVMNSDFSPYIETSDEWIRTRTGMNERYFNNGKTNYYMASEAAKAAMKDGGISPEEIDFIICCTCTPDAFYPSLSCLVQRSIGAVNAGAIDINSACTGFANALDLARNAIGMGEYKKVLIIASEMLSNHIDFNDRASCVLFGDGAGACIVGAADTPYYSYFRAEGDNFEALYCRCKYDNNSPFRTEDSDLDKALGKIENPHLFMDGKAVYKFAIEVMPKALNAVLEKAGKTIDDIDLVIPHQANIRIIQTAVKSLKIPMDKVFVNIDKHGNTSSACMLYCLDDLKKAGRLKKGMRLAFVGFGGGFTYGAIYMEY